MQTDALRSYDPRPYPQIPGGEGRFITEELRKLSVCMELIRTVAKQLETRIAALGG
jgi:hypothetical protein